MDASDKKVKWTRAEKDEHIKRIQQIIDEERREVKERHFTCVTTDDLEAKFDRVNSPMIVFQSWNSPDPGGTLDYELVIYNPDPTEVVWLFAHVWVGSGNVDPNVGTYLQNVDARFPRLTQPSFSGLTLPAGDRAKLAFAMQVPGHVESTNYIGNSCLMRFNWHDVGTYLDRGVFVFDVA